MRNDPEFRGGGVEAGMAAVGRWDVGAVDRIEPLAGGSRSSPKWVVFAAAGNFVLKRRAPGRNAADRLPFAHAFVREAAQAGIPVAAPIASRSGGTHEEVDGAIYELFPRIFGARWSRLPEQAMLAGEILGRLHRVGLRMEWHGPVRAGSFHGSMTVFEALRRAPEAIAKVDPARAAEAKNLCAGIAEAYREASARVEDLGIAALGSQVVHGDFHPGNLLFDGDVVAAVIDFDAARIEPAVVDFSNGLLQFGSRGGKGRTVAEWPAELNETRVTAFTQGYRRNGDVGLDAIADMVPPLMIEACVAEASIPIAQRGQFGSLPGVDVLTLVRRKSRWIAEASGSIARRLRASLS